MTVTLKADGTTGTVAIWEGPGDAPFTDPLGNVARLRFHSDLEYPSIIDVRSGSVTFPALAVNQTRQAVYPLFYHNQGGTPFVEGTITVGPNTIAFSGSVPVARGEGVTGAGYWAGREFARWAHLGVTPTEVVISEFSVSPHYEPYPEIEFNWTVYVTDWTFDV